ncbi:VOC family protein [Shimia sp. MMG029]|uniref:VOC family protein n=1 Tax=Shimia sp. MMG029 TaxID=3021978 RepID=UPI0022FE27A3|nr:VOC family protein [Shimia sp. MMG029]MDA5557149.1 VOC family protein [Shimia sp. MMG029]
MPKMNTIGWFDIYVTDLPRAVAFYENVFDCSLEDIGDPTGETQMRAFPTDMSLYGAGGALSKSPHAQPGAGGTIVYFNTEDCTAEETRVTAAGGQVLRPKFSIGEFGFVSLCQDTEGNIFGLSSTA